MTVSTSYIQEYISLLQNVITPICIDYHKQFIDSLIASVDVWQLISHFALTVKFLAAISKFLQFEYNSVTGQWSSLSQKNFGIVNQNKFSKNSVIDKSLEARSAQYLNQPEYTGSAKFMAT